MHPFHHTPLAVNTHLSGTGKISQNPYLKTHGTHAKIKTPDHEFIFNRNGEIRFIRGLGTAWPHPSEQLKRTDGNDWVHYSVGDDSTENGIISWMGDYYLPCLPYPSNPVWEVNYMANPAVMTAFAAWSQLFATLYDKVQSNTLAPNAMELARQILAHDDQTLFNRSQNLKQIIGTPVSVLPPDTRHVDYDVIPLVIADGCLYNCRFCCVKSAQKFQPRSQTAIQAQIRRLREYYGHNLENYNAVFLGNHDALAAGESLVCTAAEAAFAQLGFNDGREATPRLFMFGSVKALADANRSFFERLDRLPFQTVVNIGLESVDPDTLRQIGKPLSPAKVVNAFEKICTLNDTLTNVELTANFLMGTHLGKGHYQSLAALLAHAPQQNRKKGGIYLSPVKDSPKKRELLPQFRQIKAQSRLPVFIYLIQRF